MNDIYRNFGLRISGFGLELVRLRLCFCFTLLSALTSSAVVGDSQAPPVFIEPSTALGGQLVHENVPYQPSALFIEPATDQAPIVLEELPPPYDVPFESSGLPPGFVPLEEQTDLVTEPQLPPGARDGVFQKLYFTSTWLPQFESDSLGWGDLEMGVVLGFPFLRRETPLLVTPQFGVHFLERPTTPDLPDRVYDAAVEFRHLRKFGNGPWAMDLSVTLGYYSDFEIDAGQAFRETGRGLVVYESSPVTKWIFGISYLNRSDISVLPVGGVIHEPSSDVRWELVFPRPRLAWRSLDSIPGCDESWFYIGGEFGSGVWSIERPLSGSLDLITYSDYRILIGYERKIVGGLSRRFEFGYVFGRELDFASATPDFLPDDTLLLRAGLTY